MIPKVTRYQSRRLLDEARGRTCVLCEHDADRRPMSPEDKTVPAHLPGAFYGMPSGTGQKTHDWLVAHLCEQHHDWIDGPGRKDAQLRMLALCLTLQRLFADGTLIVRR